MIDYLSLVGEEATATLIGSGRTYEFVGLITSANLDIAYDNTAVVTLSVRAMDGVKSIGTPVFIEGIKNARKMDTWECSYCGTGNPMSNRYCGGDEPNGCKAVRPFLLSEIS